MLTEKIQFLQKHYLLRQVGISSDKKGNAADTLSINPESAKQKL